MEHNKTIETSIVPEIEDFFSGETQSTSDTAHIIANAANCPNNFTANTKCGHHHDNLQPSQTAQAEPHLIQSPSQGSSYSENRNLSALSIRSAIRASRPSVKECLKVPDEEMADLSLDVYNMFFLSDLFSQPFFYSLAVVTTKFMLYIILFIDFEWTKKYPWEKDMDAKPSIKMAQIILIPVAILVEEELMTSIFIAGNLQYSKGIMARHPGATAWKFYLSNIARFADGLLFLFINSMVMMVQTTDVLGLFLNFAALQFLQTIDNVTLQVCLEGYWTKSLQETARDVVDMKFVYRHSFKHDCLQTSFVVGLYVILVGCWANVHWGHRGVLNQ